MKNLFMNKDLKVLYYYLINPKLRYQFYLICKRKVLNLLFFNVVNKKKITFSNVKILSKKQVYKLLNIKEVINPQKKYIDIFNQQKNSINNNPYKFGGAGDIEILYNISKDTKIKNILETGVANGWSSLAILLSIKDDKNKFLTSIDLPYPFKNSEKYIGLAVPENLKHKWNLIIDDDKKIMNNFMLQGKKFDFVHN